MRIGIDIGRVIINPRAEGRADTSFLGASLQDALHTPPALRSFEVIKGLVELSEGCSYLISKCGPSVQAKTRAWLDHHDFWKKTGFNPAHLFFCLKRREKAIFAHKLELDVMIDDRVDVHQHLQDIVLHCLLFGEQRDTPPDWVVHVQDWTEVESWFEALGSKG